MPKAKLKSKTTSNHPVSYSTWYIGQTLGCNFESSKARKVRDVLVTYDEHKAYYKKPIFMRRAVREEKHQRALDAHNESLLILEETMSNCPVQRRSRQQPKNMKCSCKECGGTGTVICPECDGVGAREYSIENITLDKSMHNYEELVTLKKDAERVKRQAERLSEINPARKELYAEQLKSCLLIINKQAEKAAKRY